MNSLIYTAILVFIMAGFVGWSVLSSHFPGKGVQVITNIFKETMPFEQAVVALKEGHKIRRKSERKGFVKIVITSGQTSKEKFGNYWVHSPDDISEYCIFSVEDVLATDWIIDEKVPAPEQT